MTVTSSAFHLPDRLAPKADPDLIAADELHFARIAATLEESVAELTERLAAVRRMPGGGGQDALERDLEVHRLSARLRLLRRYRLDLCLGRIVTADGPVYIGRVGLSDPDGRPLLIDWRAPAAEPYFAATPATPMGVVSRRRYRWSLGRVVDYWDEAFTSDADGVALDEDSALLATLGASRSPRMRDVLSTIQADQDAIIRAGSRGALVVDGGPGTGKTVVALHRAAYLLYSDPRIGERGGVLFVGPNPAYLAYVSDVLPSLGEEGVLTCTLPDLVPEGEQALPEPDPAVARLKSSADLVSAVETGVRFYERPPSRGMTIETEWAAVDLEPDDWADAFDVAEPGTPHNEARDRVWDELVAILLGKSEEEAPPHLLRRALVQDPDLRTAFARAWPLLDPVPLVRDLWASPAYLHQCAPWLSDDEVRLLQRKPEAPWTVSDLPLLDAARRRVGDPEASGRERRRVAALAAQQDVMARVVEDLIAADDSEMLLMSMLRREDARNSLMNEAELPTIDPDLLAGPFAHVVVDEAQELTDAEWRMLLARCPSRSFTVVGDRAQARQGFAETWEERLGRIGLRGARVASLTINYRTPEEVMREAEPIIRAALPDANVPTSIRSTGVPVRYAGMGERDAILDSWLAAHDEGVACVIGDASFAGAPRVRSLTPVLAKGLEFDLVVLVRPEAFGDGIEGAVDRYVAMTRATQQLVVLT